MIAAVRACIFGIYSVAFYIGGVFVKEKVYDWYQGQSYDASAILTVVMSLVTGLTNSMGIMPNI